MWKQYGIIFAHRRLIVPRSYCALPTMHRADSGNDLALDDIAFRPCGAKITADIQNSATDTIDVCEGNMNTYNFSGNASSQYQSPVYHWQLSTDQGSHGMISPVRQKPRTYGRLLWQPVNIGTGLPW